MQLVVLGLNHKTAPVEIRERFAVATEALPDAAKRVRAAGASESFVVSTCNRVELYATCEDGEPIEGAISKVMAELGETRLHRLEPHLYTYRGEDAVIHLFRVAASLDSMVVGEPQILGQLKKAFEQCRAAGVTGPGLNRALERAFSVAKRVRTQTGIGRNVVSISSVAVELATQIFGELEGRSAALVGAGKMGELAARHLCSAGVTELFVANRNLENATRIADELGGHPRTLGELPGILARTDIVIASTGARNHIITRELMKEALKLRKYRPIFIIDIAVPRNVDPHLNELENVYLYDVDDLTAITDENMAARRKEADAAETMVRDHAQRFLRDLTGIAVTPTIVALRAHAENIRDEELAKAVKKMGSLEPDQLSALKLMADGIVNKLLHRSLMKLKASASEPDAEETLKLVRELYSLEENEEEQ